MKNKEIEEILNILCYEISCQAHYQKSNHLEVCKNCICKCRQYELLEKIFSYIEQLEKGNKDLDKENQMLFEKNLQLETYYKEANESVTWWQNRYNAIVKQNDNNHKKVIKLENNRDKAIEYVEEKGRLKYNPNELIYILKGGSDD